MRTKTLQESTFVKALRKFTSSYGIVVVTIVMIVICSIISPKFLTTSNILNVLCQSAVFAMIACAEGALIISGNIDLSAGSTVCMAGILAIPVYVATGSHIIALLFSIFCGVAMNALSGFFVSVFKLPAFVATLAMQMSVRGAAKVYTGGMVLTETGENFSFVGQGYIGGIFPMPVLLMLVAVVLMWIVLDRTRFGRNLFALGGNREAARASGINVDRYAFYAFLFAGVFIGLAGYVQASRVNAGIPTSCVGYEGKGISAAIIGGVGFAGGTGSAWGVLVGSIIIGIISNILNLMQADSYVQEVINGLIIVVAVVLDLQTKKKRVGA